MRTISDKELRKIVDRHGRWIRGEEGGECAYLVCTDLTGANLYSTYLTGANLAGANLREANLEGADLTEANLDGTKR